MDMSQITDLLDDLEVPHYDGYPSTGARLPYVVNRPLLIDPINLAISGDAIDWDYQFTLYCCGGSVAASFNLAQMVMSHLQGKRVGSVAISTSMGYSGAQVEGHYESAVVVQLNSGGLS